MKKLLLMAAFVAGPILYAQQKPTAINDLKKEEQKSTQAADVKLLNVSDAKTANKKTSLKNTEAKAKTPKKRVNTKSLKDAIEN